MVEPAGNPSGVDSQYKERRSVPRFSFIAEVDVTDLATEARISGRVSEISRKGCFVDVLNTLPVGTSVVLKISRDQGTFTTKGKIIYTQEGMGMGVGFLETAPDQLNILDAWIMEISS